MEVTDLGDSKVKNNSLPMPALETDPLITYGVEHADSGSLSSVTLV